MRDEYLDIKNAKKDDSERAHCDFPMNLSWASGFISRMQSSLKRGMSISIRDSHGLKQALVTIVWKPPIDAKRGNYADSIFLHQNHSLVVREVQNIFDRYLRMVGHWEERNVG